MVYSCSSKFSVRNYIKQEARKISLKEATVFFDTFDMNCIKKNHHIINYDKKGKWVDFIWCKRKNPFIIRVIRTKNNILIFEKKNPIINCLFAIIVALYCFLE